MVAEAADRGIHVLIDLVPNHTSDRHPWFVDARSSRSADRRDWYVWADGGPDGSPPNNWRSSFGGPAWTWDEATGQYYLHNFLPEQPDLNWWNPQVADAFDDIVRFWLDRGIAGFRIDVAHALVKDRSLRDDTPALETDHPSIRRHGLRSDFSMNRPEGHDVLRRWRTIADSLEASSSERRGSWIWTRWRASTGTATMSSTSRSTCRSSSRRRARRCARSSNGPRRCCPRPRGLSGTGRTTTPAGSRAVGAKAMNDAPEPPSSCSSRSEVRRSSTSATRSGCATSRYPGTG